MDVLFATNFSNEQASAYSERVEILPKANIVRSQVTPTGYDIAVNAVTGTTYLNLPNISPQSGKALTYGCTLEITGLSGDLNVFGHIDLEVGTYNLCSVIKGGNTYLYKEGRYVGKLTGEFNRFELTSGTLSAILNNVYVVANTSEVQSLSFDFVKLALSEISNQGWFYNGSSLLESINKDETLLTDPSINTNSYEENLILNAGNREDIVLVESAGYIEQGAEDKYAIYVESTGASTTLRRFRDTPGAVSSVTIKGGQFSLYRGDAPMLAKVKSTGSEEVALLLQRTAQVDWGDGSPLATVPAGVVFRHTYPKGEYTLALYGENVESIRISGSAFLGLTAWGNPGANHYAFYISSVSDTKEIGELPATLPKHITSLREMFRDREYATDKKWDTSHVTDFRGMLQGTLDGGTFDSLSFASAVNADDFMNGSLMNPEIGHLAPTKIATANRMFKNAVNFNRPMWYWDTSLLEQAEEFLLGADSFNNDLDIWCVSKLLSEPVGFANPGVTWKKPLWGTCLPLLEGLSASHIEVVERTGNRLSITERRATSVIEGTPGTLGSYLSVDAPGFDLLNVLNEDFEIELGIVNGSTFATTGTNNYVLLDTDVVNSQKLYLGYRNNNTLVFQYGNTAHTKVVVPYANTRHHFLISRQGSSISVLMNGDEVFNITHTVNEYTKPKLYIGSSLTAGVPYEYMLYRIGLVAPLRAPENLFYTTDYVKAPIIIDSYYKD